MTEQERDEIAALAIIMNEKRLALDMWAAMNTAGLSSDELEQRRVSAYIAQTEYFEAEAAMRRAQNRIAGAI